MAENDQQTAPEQPPLQPGAPEVGAAMAARPEQRPEAEPQGKSCVLAAAEAIERARVELQRAQEFYQQVRQEAAEQIKQVRQTTLGDLFDGLGRLVRKFPGPSLLVALVVGFLLGRKSRW